MMLGSIQSARGRFNRSAEGGGVGGRGGGGKGSVGDFQNLAHSKSNDDRYIYSLLCGSINGSEDKKKRSSKYRVVVQCTSGEIRCGKEKNDPNIIRYRQNQIRWLTKVRNLPAKEKND